MKVNDEYNMLGKAWSYHKVVSYVYFSLHNVKFEVSNHTEIKE